ncbi:MAG: PilZ domain-containing protein [Treponema sp.]|nr:PilZ domain-containing protein [Treponema sp.]
MGSGSPLAARLSPTAYSSIVIGLILIGIALVVWIIYKAIQLQHQNPKYIEAQKNRPTNSKDIKLLSRLVNLNPREVELLWKICREQKAPNVLHHYTEDQWLDTYFKGEYQKLAAESKPNYDLIYELFRLRFHIDRINSYSINMKHTTKIPVGTIMTYPAPSGFRYQLTLIKNDSHGLLIQCPKGLFENEGDTPEKLSKIALLFRLNNKIQYSTISRVIQYIPNSEGSKDMLITHTDAVSPQLRRQSRRFEVTKAVKFSAVTANKGIDGKPVFTVKENVYEGAMADLSEGGCNLLLKLPIRAGQYINLKFEANNKPIDTIGLIVMTKLNPELQLYAVHICFKKITLIEKVEILADIYKYNL